MYIVNTSQMQAAEKSADAGGLSYAQMMENAGQAIALAIEEQFAVVDEPILILIGPGNNGGDGLVVARHLSQAGADVAVYVWKRSNLADDPNWALLDDTDVIRILSHDEDSETQLRQWLEEATIIVDALLGTGVSRPIEGELADLLDQAKATIAARFIPFESQLVEPNHPSFMAIDDPIVVAVDVPSGLNSDTGEVDPYTLSADLTVTLAAVKQGHILGEGVEVTGRLIIGDIGITPENYPPEVTMEMATTAKVVQLLPPRPNTAHKSTFGRALVVAGSRNYTGAAILAAQAAAHSGVGWVMLACPETIYPIVASRLPEVTYLPLADEADQAATTLQENFDLATAMLIGPGIGQSEKTIQLMQTILAAKRSTLPALVIDADGLNIIAQQSAWWKQLPSESILTPHPGEMARLMDCSVSEVLQNRLTVAPDMAAKWGQVVVLKGAYTIVAAPDGRMMVLPFANPALAKAGSGDVLAGITVSLRAQGMAPFDAAVTGAYLHGLTGQIAAENLSVMPVTALDLVEYLPSAIRDLTGE